MAGVKKAKRFVEDVFEMGGTDQARIRKMLNIHPRRRIPASITAKYKSAYNMVGRFNSISFSREFVATLCLSACKVEKGRVGKTLVILVNGEDLSLSPDEKD